MKIICNTQEFAGIIRSCETYGDCNKCALQTICCNDLTQGAPEDFCIVCEEEIEFEEYEEDENA